MASNALMLMERLAEVKVCYTLRCQSCGYWWQSIVPWLHIRAHPCPLTCPGHGVASDAITLPKDAQHGK